ncbi:MAG: 30S ribosomal protein S13 [Chloroflexi bacterium]|nr:30S ribosomal protein S13 [Chloroflexota bacterium]
MARVAGVEIPGKKHIGVALRYIYGVGPANSGKILTKVGIDSQVNTDDLTEEEINRLREVIDKEYIVEGELKKEINQNIKRLMEIGSYRGTRHRFNLPVRGQRTRTNARTRRGSRQTVAGRGKKRGATK